MRRLTQLATLLLVVSSSVVFSSAHALSGTISSDGPCSLSPGQSQCPAIVTWTVSDAQYPCVWVTSGTGPRQLFACSDRDQGGSAEWLHTSAAGYSFELRNHQTYWNGGDFGQFYDAGQLIAQTEVFATGIFVDVVSNSPSLPAIEAMYRAGITSGCTGAPAYCPTGEVLRQQMATFLVRAIHGKRQGVSYSPGTLTHNLQDVSSALLKDFAVKSYLDGIILSCGSNDQGPLFCPDGLVPRRDMAGMLLRAKYGGNYSPPTPGPTAMFADVPIGHADRAWIEQLAKEGITQGCTATTYCPNSNVTREQMAIFLARTFALIPGTTPSKYATYFGVAPVSAGSSVSSITETGPHINMVHTAGWGDTSTPSGRLAIMNDVVWQLREARRLGVAASMVSTSFLVFRGDGQWGNNGPFDVAPAAEAIAELRTFFDLLRSNGVIQRVAALFVVDEPRFADGVEITEQETELAAALNRQVMAEYYPLKGAKLSVNYEKDKYVATHAFDWLGVDDYAAGEGVLTGAYQALKSQLDLSRQKTILVPGGANGTYWTPVLPWAFLNTLLNDPDAVLMMSFLWFDRDAGLGIRSNGMRIPYCQVGAQIRGVSPGVCN